MQQAARASRVVVAAAAGAPHLQLATAKLPTDTNVDAFVEQLYQWAATLTTNGRNLPFALPLRCDKLGSGFQVGAAWLPPSSAAQHCQ